MYKKQLTPTLLYTSIEQNGKVIQGIWEGNKVYFLPTIKFI